MKVEEVYGCVYGVVLERGDEHMGEDESWRFGGAVVNLEAMSAHFILDVSQIRKWRSQLTGILKKGRNGSVRRMIRKEGLAKTKGGTVEEKASKESVKQWVIARA